MATYLRQEYYLQWQISSLSFPKEGQYIRPLIQYCQESIDLVELAIVVMK